LLLKESRRIDGKRFISRPESYNDSLLFEVNAHMAEFKKRFPDSWKNIMVQGFYAYLVKIDYEKAVELFNEVLIHDPENVEANHMLSSIYKRKLLHEKALKHNLKAFRQNPQDANILHNIVQILWNMGDLENAIKVAQKRMEMFGRIGPLFGYNYSQGKISPPEFIEYVEQNVMNKYIQRDYSTIISMTNELEMSTYANYYFKAKSYFLLEELDSACHYAQMVTEQFRDGLYYRYMLPIETMFIILGNKERAMELVQKKIDAAMQIGDHLIASYNYKKQIKYLSLLGDYEEATEKLLELNRKFPQFGGFASLHNSPGYDKIKKEYPPFLEALNNLKLPKKSDLDVDELF
jgi:tetratricopeptide (TPR) repeat protein